MDGLIIVNKPSGMSSHSVCHVVKKLTNSKKCGHTGTLDPMAEGVLLVLCGNATKLSEYMVLDDKEYVADVVFGITTDTQDTTGTVLTQTEPKFTEYELRQAVSSFVGTITQTVPIYSAIKRGGRALYSYARSGQTDTVELPQREVDIYAAELLSFDEQHTARLRVACSKGTYIRTICHDLGAKLGCGAAMSALTRTKTGEYTILQSHTLDELREKSEQGSLDELLIPMDEVLSNMPQITASPEAGLAVENGNVLSAEMLLSDVSAISENTLLRLYLNDTLYSIVEKRADGMIYTKKMLNVRGE